MRTLCWTLIGLAALAFSVGTIIAFRHTTFLLEPVGYWRGAIGFLLVMAELTLNSKPQGRYATPETFKMCRGMSGP